MTKADAGRLGGLQTYLRHGRSEMARRGRMGGRPRSKTYSELFPAAAANNEEKEAGIISTLNLDLSLKELRELWKIKREEGLAPG